LPTGEKVDWPPSPLSLALGLSMAIARDLQLLIAAIAAIASVAGALILPNFWLRVIVLLVGLLIAAQHHRAATAGAGRNPVTAG
jgi:hypothetical protein